MRAEVPLALGLREAPHCEKPIGGADREVSPAGQDGARGG
jgi:hypothetical protein